MSELQEKLKKDMLAFQEKLQHVQQQTMLTKAENLAKEAEVWTFERNLSAKIWNNFMEYAWIIQSSVPKFENEFWFPVTFIPPFLKKHKLLLWNFCAISGLKFSPSDFRVLKFYNVEVCVNSSRSIIVADQSQVCWSSIASYSSDRI